MLSVGVPNNVAAGDGLSSPLMVPRIGADAEAAGTVRSAVGCWRDGADGLLPITGLLDTNCRAGLGVSALPP
jgi:hypothetical protein